MIKCALALIFYYKYYIVYYKINGFSESVGTYYLLSLIVELYYRRFEKTKYLQHIADFTVQYE